jgi:hypothetical protein
MLLHLLHPIANLLGSQLRRGKGVALRKVEDGAIVFVQRLADRVLHRRQRSLYPLEA